MPKFAANLSFLFTDVPFPERFQRAAAAGFNTRRGPSACARRPLPGRTSTIGEAVVGGALIAPIAWIYAGRHVAARLKRAARSSRPQAERSP